MNKIKIGNKCSDKVQLEISKNAIFYFAFVSPFEENSKGNSRFTIESNGKVYRKNNSMNINYGEIPIKVFNQSTEEFLIAVLSQASINVLIRAIYDLGFFELPEILSTPENLKIHGGNDAFIYCKKEDNQKCVKMERGVKLSEEIFSVFNKAIESSIE